MLEPRITAPSDLTEAVLERLETDPAVSALAVVRGASLKPRGDLVTAELPREAANEIIDHLRDLGVHAEGSVHLGPVPDVDLDTGLRRGATYSRGLRGDTAGRAHASNPRPPAEHGPGQPHRRSST